MYCKFRTVEQFRDQLVIAKRKIAHEIGFGYAKVMPELQKFTGEVQFMHSSAYHKSFPPQKICNLWYSVLCPTLLGRSAHSRLGEPTFY